jgi:MbtH protein
MEKQPSHRYVVVRNDEEQYSIWPSGRAVPAGWHPAGVEGEWQVCIEHIERIWTDIGPASVRRQYRNV